MPVNQTNNTPQRVGFLLLPKFSLMAFAAASEPLRIANWLSGKKLYEWWLLSEDGAPVMASNHMPCIPDHAISEITECDMIVVCASFDPEIAATRQSIHWLRRLARSGTKMGSLDTGSLTLATAGLLDGYKATIHWEHLDSFTEQFPSIEARQDIFVIDRNRFTSAGGTASMDMMLHFIHLQHGRPLANLVAEEFIHTRIREAEHAQRPPLENRLATVNPHILKAVELMENHLEDILLVKEITKRIGISQKELERLFKHRLNITPAHYYKNLRLERAYSLLHQTNLDIIEVAVSCGFSTQAHFSREYKKKYGHPPSVDRRIKYGE